MSSVTMRQLLEAGAHFGHQTRYWNPQMAPYIFGDRNKIHIINLEKSLPLLKDATNYAGKIAASGGTVLFVGTKRSARDAIREEAERCGMPYVNHRWLGGMLTNFKTIKQSVNRLKDLEAMSTEGGFNAVTKKESLMMSRELEKLDKSLGGIKDMKRMPDVVFVLDVGYEKIAVLEANKLNIPVIAVVDTNHSPKGVDYVVPGNDDAIRAIQLYVASIADAIVAGKASRPVAPPKEDKPESKPVAKKPSKAGKSHSVKPAAAATAAVAAVAAEPAAAEPAAAEPVAVEAAPAAVADADNLTRIEGIGPKIEELLQAAGIKTFAALAGSSSDDVRKILADAGGRFAAHDPETWPKQSEMARDGKWNELEIWQDELDGGKVASSSAGEEE